jgi:hypothetical protein
MLIARQWDTRKATPSISRTRLNHMVNRVVVITMFVALTNNLEGAFTVGKITEEQRFDVVRHACPGPGACGGMYTYVLISFLSALIRWNAQLVRPTGPIR